MTYTIEIDAGDLPIEYTGRSDNLIETQLENDLQALASDMNNVGPRERKRALGFAILEALQRRETGTVADSAPNGDDRTPRGKRNLSTHTNPTDDDSDGQTVTDDDGVKRTKEGKYDLREHTDVSDD